MTSLGVPFVDGPVHMAGQKRSCSGGSFVVPVEPDAATRENLQQQIGRIIEDMMRDDMGHSVWDMSEKALQRLADRLLSFTLGGERYLCLNMASRLECLTAKVNNQR